MKESLEYKLQYTIVKLNDVPRLELMNYYRQLATDSNVAFTKSELTFKA
jgi:hypothetical protein